MIDVQDTDDPAVQVHDEDGPPPKKRVRRADRSNSASSAAAEGSTRTTRKGAKRVGKLAKLQEMPLDVLFEVRSLICYACET
jgi:hypothetical protein